MPLFVYWARCMELAPESDPELANKTEAQLSVICQRLADKRNDSTLSSLQKDVAHYAVYTQIATTVPSLLVTPFVRALCHFAPSFSSLRSRSGQTKEADAEDR